MSFLEAAQFRWSNIALTPLAMAGLAVTAVVLMVRGIQSGLRQRASYSRHCGKCGRGLTQQPDAPFCGYCGQKLA